jgi:hypothetical protein
LRKRRLSRIAAHPGMPNGAATAIGRGLDELKPMSEPARHHSQNFVAASFKLGY